MRTADDLRQKQALPLSLKIALTKDRIRQWVNEYGDIGIQAPNIEKYEEIYGDERTRRELIA